jgi:hypothetical protein
MNPNTLNPQLSALSPQPPTLQPSTLSLSTAHVRAAPVALFRRYFSVSRSLCFSVSRALPSWPLRKPDFVGAVLGAGLEDMLDDLVLGEDEEVNVGEEAFDEEAEVDGDEAGPGPSSKGKKAAGARAKPY